VSGEAGLYSEESRRSQMKTTRSKELFERAQKVIPGGVSSPVRAMRAVGRDPLFINSASGAELVDVDGNRFIDYVCSWGPLVAGHAHPDVVAAVGAAAARGTSYGAPTEAEVELAEQVVSRVPSAEMVRLVNSGTEATMTAIRVARSATGRDRVLKFSGAYHGHVDGLLADAGSGLATQGIPASPGVTKRQAADTLVCEWNDGGAFAELIAASGEELAAVIAEPLPANMGVVPAAAGFLELLRERCVDCGALLIFDEVISGFRVSSGGMQALAGVKPDLTVLGKVLGGGLPLAAVAGPAGSMERLAPAGETYQAGTLSGNPLATAAGLATLELLTQDAYARLEATTTKLATGLKEAADDAGVPIQLASECGLLTVFFSDRAVESYQDARASDAEAFARFHNSMLEQGIYLPPSQFEAWFPSLAHDEKQIERTIATAARAFEAVAA
jgi:glutamate-1-semialdehyde 2,1-aminomutase